MTVFKRVIGQGEEVVLLHGWAGCTHEHMQPIADFLGQYYRVTNMDLPGAGHSDWSAGIENIHDIADVLLPHLPEQAIYIGWSFGGLVSLSIAARYPLRVKQFIGLGSTPKFIESENWPGVPAPGFKASFSEIKARGIKSFLKDFFYDVEFSDFDPKPEDYYKVMRIMESAANIDQDILFKGIDICDATDLRNEFVALKQPLTFILGDHDSAVPNKTHEKIKSLNANVNIHVIPGAKHLFFWTHRKEFFDVLGKVMKVAPNYEESIRQINAVR